jgi:hypothetical protein
MYAEIGSAAKPGLWTLPGLMKEAFDTLDCIGA